MSDHLSSAIETTSELINYETTKGLPIVKRVIDVLLSAIIIEILSPLLIVAMILIKLDSKGPVFFKQVRVGQGGEKFICFKFRTMQHNCDTDVHQKFVRALINKTKDGTARLRKAGDELQKLENDTRITRIGRILRKLSIDEVPQFINVLRGEMTIVGPRPAIDYELKAYKDWYFQRLCVVPGITGLWQVSGRSKIGYEDMITLDIKYINEQSIWMDLKIIFKTFFAIFKMEGAA